MLMHCDTQVANHCHNQENMLIAESFAAGKIKASKQHFCCSPLVSMKGMDKPGNKGGGAA